MDGTAYTAPITLQLAAGTHAVDASIAQTAPAGTRYNFLSWSDAGAASHNVATLSPVIFIANFTTQYQLTTAVSPTAVSPTAGGTIAPPAGWYDSNTALTVNATPSPGYQFTAFSGPLTGATTPQTLTLTAPATLTATFQAVPTTTIQSVPADLTFTVDNAACPSPCLM